MAQTCRRCFVWQSSWTKSPTRIIVTDTNPAKEPVKVLFICSRNEIRSLTAERMLAGSRDYQVRSAGTEAGARVRVTAGHLGWADVIFVMEKRHRERLAQKFGERLVGKSLVCLHIPDEFEYGDAALAATLRAKLEGYLVLPPEGDALPESD